MMNNTRAYGLGALATATAVAMPLTMIGVNNGVENATSYRSVCNVVNHIYKYEQSSCTAKKNVSINGYDVDAFCFIENKFNISINNRDYVRQFAYATSNLIELKRYVCEKFGEVSIELEPFLDGNVRYLCANIQCSDDSDLDEALNNLQLVSEAWFSSTDISVSKNILIDLVV